VTNIFYRTFSDNRIYTHASLGHRLGFEEVRKDITLIESRLNTLLDAHEDLQDVTEAIRDLQNTSRRNVRSRPAQQRLYLSLTRSRKPTEK